MLLEKLFTYSQFSNLVLHNDSILVMLGSGNSWKLI